MFDLDRCALVGMVHLAPLPGSPGWAGSMTDVCAAARRDAEALVEGGVDAILVENMGDVPYLRGRVDPETVAAFAVATAPLAQLGKPLGVQVLAGANREALGVALAAGAAFVRVEAFAYAHVADEGLLQASAAELLRARRALGADIQIWADVQKKHSAHAITGDLSLAELAKGSAFCGADALVVTGRSTGESTAKADVEAARAADLPVVVGSGVTPADAGALARVADALIVGSYLKVDGDWRNPVDATRVKAVREAL
jgi:membrane complex biogenesis BtpA family protein